MKRSPQSQRNFYSNEVTSKMTKYACIPVSDIWKLIIFWCDVGTATRLLCTCKFVHFSVSEIDLIQCIIRNGRGAQQQTVQRLLVTSSKFNRLDITRSMVSAGIVPTWVVGKIYSGGDYVSHDTIAYFCKKRNLSCTKTSPYTTPELWCVTREAPW